MSELASTAALDANVASAKKKVRRYRQMVMALRIAFGLGLVGSWELLSRTKTIDPFFFGKPSDIARVIWRWVTVGTPDGPLFDQVWVTLEEALLGFLIGVVAGVVFGLALGRIRLLAEVLGPYIKAANSIPRVVLGSIFIIWLGLGLPSKVALAFVLVFFVVFFNAFQGVREVNEDVIANARILGANRRKVTTQVVLPSALTWIIASLHTSFGFALVGAVVGEFIGSIHGLGHLIAFAQGTFDTNAVFAAMFILAVIALVAEFLITALENRLITWRPSRRDEVAL
ncbi:MAG TPA: ABC transporter permease [Gaiellaceae bacterium]|jgi:NitT/TauT family transport system permease protein|nr:ABC transporter permease [Gaiellaceae bacterium]